jgi:hypothetical protein
MIVLGDYEDVGRFRQSDCVAYFSGKVGGGLGHSRTFYMIVVNVLDVKDD